MAEQVEDFDPIIDSVGIDDPAMAVFQRKIISLAAGDAVTVDARGMKTMSVFAGSGATVTWSRVLSASDTTHGTGNLAVTAPAASALESLDVDWPFYRVSTAGGTALVCVV